MYVRVVPLTTSKDGKGWLTSNHTTAGTGRQTVLQPRPIRTRLAEKVIRSTRSGIEDGNYLTSYAEDQHLTMPRWTLTICLIALILGSALAKRGGGSKSSSKSGSKSSGSSYPKQQWTNPNNRDSQGSSKTPSAPPGYPSQNPGNPGYPNKNPGYPSYPPYPNNNVPPPYSAPGHHYPAPPAYSAPGHPYPAPPGYPTGHSYPSGAGYPNYPGVPGSAKPGKIGKSGGGIGTHLGAAAVGAVAGAAIASTIQRPKIKIYSPGHHYHGEHYHDGYSSSEEFFNPYYTGPNGAQRGYRGLNLNELSPEELQIVQLAQAMIGLCEKMRQPSVCTLLKMHGLRPFTHPNSMFREHEEPRPIGAPHSLNLTEQNNTANADSTADLVGHGAIPNNDTTTTVVSSTKWYPEAMVKEDPVPTAFAPKPEITTELNLPHLSEDQLKAADDLLKALGNK